MITASRWVRPTPPVSPDTSEQVDRTNQDVVGMVDEISDHGDGTSPRVASRRLTIENA